MIKLLLSIITILFMTSCSIKDKDIYNKPAIFWYKKIISDIKSYDLESADDFYASLASEHINSPLLKEATKIMALAHMDDESYRLANYYFDEYIKMFGTKRELEEARFFKVEAKYYGILRLKRDQQLIRDTIKEAKEFKYRYPNSRYKYYIDTIIVKLEAGRYELLKDIASLHKKLGNREAYKIYQERIKNSFINRHIKIIEPNSGFLRNIFE